MPVHYETPGLDKDAFTCPRCGVYSAMKWEALRTDQRYVSLALAACHRCRGFSVWYRDYSDDDGCMVGSMIDPGVLLAPLPNEDMPDVCRGDYMEAREISNKSPRGAAALLRLCLQKLCRELGGKGENINKDIAFLVENGLPKKIQKALDVVRVVGNNAVHPGEISVEDQPETVHALFGLVNLIVDNQITQPKHIDDLFDGLPEGAKEAVKKRDS